MKYFVCLMVLTVSAFAEDRINIYDVKKIDVSGDEASIRFSDDDRVFRMSESSGVFSCIKNGWLAQQKVIVKRNEKDQITDCRLYSGGVLGFEDESPKIQAQEAKTETEKPVKKP